MHDAQMHDNEASNAWRVLQRLKELDQGPKEHKSTIGTFPHPNVMIFWNKCLMRSETRVARIRTGDAHRQGGKGINHMLYQLTTFDQIRFSLQSTTSKKLKFIFSFNSFKSLKLRAMWSKMTKGITMVTNNGFSSVRLFREVSSNMVLFSLQHGTLRSYVTNHTTMMASRNKLRSTQIPRMRPNETLSLRAFLSTFWFLLCGGCTSICL